MRPKAVISLLIAIVLGISTVFGAEESRAHVGMMLDPQPLPELLVKHLRLAEGEGARILNVIVGSPADKAELKRDDIVVGFDGMKIDDAEELIEELKQYEPGQEAEFEIIHLGRRKTVTITLGLMEGEIEWKYPWEPQASHQWLPGRVIRLRPGQEAIEIPFDELMRDPNLMNEGGRLDVTKFLGERYRFEYSDGGRDYQIMIEGDPRDEDTVIVVKIDNKEHRVSVEDIDQLPGDYHKSAVDALGRAKRGRGRGRATIEIGPDGAGFRDNPTMPDFPWPPSELGLERFNRIEKRLQQLQERLELLEEQRRRRDREDVQKDEQKESSSAIGVGILIDKRKRT